MRVNNTGGVVDGFAKFDAFSDQDWFKTFDVNLGGPVASISVPGLTGCDLAGRDQTRHQSARSCLAAPGHYPSQDNRALNADPGFHAADWHTE